MTKYPIPSFFFQVDLNGVQMSFQEVSGLEENAEVLEYRHGKSKSLVTQKRAGLIKSSTITLKRGVFHSETDLADMLKVLQNKQYQTGEAELPELAIKLLDEQKEVVLHWVITNPVPIKWSGPGLKSDSNEPAIESIEFAHEGLSLR
ncbi:MAG: phage tail protein [Bacteroidota bacterium]